MTDPLVTIVIPVYNGEAYLDEAIRSVMSQNYKALEVIVVDDGSTDRSAEIARNYVPQIMLIEQANAGQSAALEAGWHASAGAFIGYLSADDLLNEDAVTVLVAALIAEPAIVLAYPDFRIIDAESNVTGAVTPPDYSRRRQIGDLHCLPGPGALFRRSAYERAGPWRRDLRQIADLEFFLRLTSLGDFIHVGRQLASFRKHDESATYRSVERSRADEPLILIARHFSEATIEPHFRPHRRRGIANALLLSAIIHGQSGRPFTAIRRIISAVLRHPATLTTARGFAALTMMLRPYPAAQGTSLQAKSRQCRS